MSKHNHSVPSQFSDTEERSNSSGEPPIAHISLAGTNDPERPTAAGQNTASTFLVRARESQFLGRFSDAAAALREAAALAPDDLPIQLELGAMLQRSGQYSEATKVYVAIIQANPRCAEAFTNLGTVCLHLGDLKLAEETHRQAIALAPEMPDAHCNLGVVFSKQGRTDEAMACFGRTLALNPKHAGAYLNIGFQQQHNGDIESAEASYQHALACDPKNKAIEFYLANVHLLQGRYREGWLEYESRWFSIELSASKRDFVEPQWQGEALNGEPILLYAEQGLGDTMQFLRYVPMVAERGGRVILEVPAGLRRLSECVPGVAQLISRGDPLPGFQWQCPLMSLPFAFYTEAETVPNSVPYLRANEAGARKWAKKLPGDGLRIGLAWAGNPAHSRESARSVPLAEIAALTSLPNARFYSLQMGPSAAQVSSFPDIIDLEFEQKDFADTAAIVANLDLVISIDTSVAHLAGALAKPVWILLHHVPDWRWLLKREDCPWYPTARLFRKQAKEGWGSVIERVRSSLLSSFPK